jgi:hypothetical protein
MLCSKLRKNNDFIRALAMTTAKVHDSKIDLAEEDEAGYRNKGYSGAKTRTKGDATMKHNVRGNPAKPLWSSTIVNTVMKKLTRFSVNLRRGTNETESRRLVCRLWRF